MGNKTRKFWKKLLASGLICSMAMVGTEPTNNRKQDIVSETAKASVTQDEVTLPTGDFVFEEYTYTKAEYEAMPEFGKTNDSSFQFFSSYTTGEWNKTGLATYGSSNYGYSKLSATQKSAYMAILTATVGADYKGTDSKCFMASASLNSAEGYKVDCPSDVDMKDMIIGYCAVYEDHPELYWLKSAYSTYGNALIIPVDALYDTKTERDTIKTAMEASSGEREKYFKAYDSGTDAYGKMIGLHNKMMEDITYAYKSGTQPETAAWAHNIVGALTEEHKDAAGNHKVVCEGYAKTFQYIMNMKGVDNIYIVGQAGGGGHAWNMVNIDSVWYNMDLTWDDNEDGYGYMYTGMPASYFLKSHTPNKSTSSFWLYELPEADDTKDLSNTYFGRYHAIANEKTYTDVKSFLQIAAACSPNNDLFIVANSTDRIIAIARELGLSDYYPSSEYSGYYYVFAKGAALKYKISIPATDISIEPKKYTIDMTNKKTVPLTIKTATTGCNDYVNIEVSDSTKVSVDKYCVPFSDGTATINVTGMRNGTATIKATAAANSAITDTCEVTVSGSALAQTMFTDEAGTKPVTEDSMTAYVNGAKVKLADGTEANKKNIEFYTRLEAPTFVQSGKEKKGKIIVGITSSADVPALAKGKIVSDDASKAVAKATVKAIRNSSVSKITVTAGKDPGIAYLWILALGKQDEIVAVDYCPITIKAAPAKIVTVDDAPESEGANKYTQATTVLGGSVYVHLKGEYVDSQKKKKLASDATYSADYEKDKAYVEVAKLSEFEYKVTAKALNNMKDTTAKINFICEQNGKKAAFTLKFANPVTGLTVNSSSNDKLIKKDDKTEISYSITSAGENVPTTDKAKVLITNGCSTDTNAIILSKSSIYKGTLGGNKVTITRSKERKEAATIYITYTDKVTKKEVAYTIATIDENGTVTCN